MATELTTNTTRPRYTPEQREAWQKAKALLKTGKTDRRALHIAMSELRAEAGRQHKGPIETLPNSPEKLHEHKVAEWKQYLKDPSSKKLYLIIRPDLTTSQQAVQASHAATQFLKEHPLAPWINGTMVLLTIDTESKTWDRYLNPRFSRPDYDPFEALCRDTLYRFEFKTEWREPDQDNRITAVAALSAFQNEMRDSHLKLL